MIYYNKAFIGHLGMACLWPQNNMHTLNVLTLRYTNYYFFRHYRHLIQTQIMLPISSIWFCGHGICVQGV